MAAVDEVRRFMKGIGNFSDEYLNSLTQADIDGANNSKAITDGNWATGAKPRSANYTGNHFRIVGGVWYWDDTPGSQCGRTVTWHYTPQPGSSYHQAGNCPQGYPWFEMYCVF